MVSSGPLRFEPVFRSYLWGGRRLETDLRKPLPEDDLVYAESWEVVDHGTDQSIVAEGPFAGTSLSSLVREHGEWLLGRNHPQSKFPLLFKFLDCQRKLSVQVHPNDAQGSLLQPPDLGKTEAWLIMAAEPGSCLYAGLRDGIDRAELMRHIDQGTVDQALHQVHPQAGDCIFIPAGTVHALGDGLLVAEIQQSSNTTFRLFDWNRVDSDGNPRPLHIQQGLDVIDFDRGAVEPVVACQTAVESVERLVSCDKFELNRIRLAAGQSIFQGGDQTCHLLVAVDGEVAIGDCRLHRGETVLLPAASPPVEVAALGDAILLEVHLP